MAALAADMETKKRQLSEDVRIYEYTSAANPSLVTQPVLALSATTHESGPTRVIPFDLSAHMGLEYPATSPNLMASFIRICASEHITTSATATSQAFYIIRGAGKSSWKLGTGVAVEPAEAEAAAATAAAAAGPEELNECSWSQGDLFVLPACSTGVLHEATEDTAIYWVSDEPLLKYLGAAPCVQKFNVTHFTKERMLAEVERIKHEPGAEHRNRMGILLGNKITEDNTKTLTHTLWSLLNMLPAGDAQRPHRHNSVALDLCVSAEPSGVYTLMGPELDEDGWVKDPVRCDWITGAVFTTPPGWWHSHHNETATPAWVLPMQDAGLYTYQRTLDIRFAPPLKKSASGISMASAEVKKSH